MSEINKTENNPEQADSRRKFLKKGFLGLLATGGAVAVTSFLAAETTKTGKKVKLLGPGGKIAEVDEGDMVESNHTPDIRKGHPGKSYIMVIDLASCRNARRCIEECQKMHGLKIDQEYLSVSKMQDSENTAPYWMPQLCNHCDNPPCTKVCPVGATFKREDGIVAMDNEVCIGCRYCMAACPYQARTFNWNDKARAIAGPDDAHADCHKDNITGTVSKCDFCPDVVSKGELPSCITACPNGAFYFGDLNEDMVTNGDKVVRFSELMRDKGGYRHMENLGTKPRVYYLPPVNRSFPFEKGLDDFEKAKERLSNSNLS